MKLKTRIQTLEITDDALNPHRKYFKLELVGLLNPEECIELYKIHRQVSFLDKNILIEVEENKSPTPQERAEAAYQEQQETVQLNKEMCNLGVCIHKEHQK